MQIKITEKQTLAVLQIAIVQQATVEEAQQSKTQMDLSDQ